MRVFRFKDGISMILVPFSYMIIALFITTIYLAEYPAKSNWLFYHKFYYFIIVLLTVASNIQSMRIQPGVITHENNLRLIQIYISVRDSAFKEAEKYNVRFKEDLEKDYESHEVQTDDDEFDFGYEYSVKTKIRDAAMIEISEQFKIKLTRCRKCLVVRIPGAHHCTRCRGCVLNQDHHCPWINNCIGSFNRKHFILFCFYLMIGTLEGMLIAAYYTIYKGRPE